MIYKANKRKEVRTMKRFIALLMTAVLCLSLCACSKAHTLDETIEVNNFSYKITDVQIASSLKHGDTSSDDFFTPNGTGELAFSAPGGCALLYFNAEYTYTGSTTEDSDLAKTIFIPSVKCKGGRFDSNYAVFMREKGTTWYNLESDLSWESRTENGIALNSLSFDLEPQSDTVYEVRGCIYIPITAAENENSKITLSLSGEKFTVR